MKHSRLMWVVVFALGVRAFGAKAPQARNDFPGRTPAIHLKKHPVVALTFDDLPAAGGIPHGDSRVGIATRLVKELKAHHMKGVYGFVTAVDIDDDPDTQGAMKVWLDAGMNIGNHTWSHPALSDVTAADYIHEIAEDEPALRQYAGKRNWHWFRYPYLEEGDTLTKHEAVRGWLQAHDYNVAEVTLNFNDDDWSDPYIRCLDKRDEKGIAWLEESYMASAKEFILRGRERQPLAFGHEIPNVLLLHATAFTALMLPDIIRMLSEEGFHFQTLPRVERSAAYGIDPEVGLEDGGPFAYEVLVSRHLKDPLPPPMTPEPIEELDSVCK
jgi:peptidoglycan/xylan/chitin deacetylase (PgdA/CDA1 family)